MTTRLMLICQGATAATRASAFPADDPLEARALSAVQGLPPIAWHADFAAVSPKRAARQTADALSLRCNQDLELGDIDFGDWAGRTIADIGQEEPERLAQWLSDPGFDGHRGESLTRLFKRASGWLNRHSEDRGQTIAVTHAAVLRAMVIEVLGAPADAFWRIDIVPLSLTELRHDGRRWAMRSCGSPIDGKLMSKPTIAVT